MDSGLAEHLDLLAEVESTLRQLVRREGEQPSIRSLKALDGLGFGTEDCPPEIAWKALALLAQLAPPLAAAYASLHPAWPRPLLALDGLLAMRQGLFQHLLHQARRHAERRIMFRRPLAEQPVIRFRLVAVAAHLAWANFLAQQAEAQTLLQEVLDRARNLLHLVCGGTGYMAESAFGQGIQWLNAFEMSLCSHKVREVAKDDRCRWRTAYLVSEPWTAPLDRKTTAWFLEDEELAC